MTIPWLRQVCCSNYYLLGIFIFLAGCGAWEIPPDATPNAIESFSLPTKKTEISGIGLVEEFQREANPRKDYTLWDGDILIIEIAGREELSGKHVVGPDGKITLSIAGPVYLRGLTRNEAATAIEQSLGQYYTLVNATVRVQTYSSNRVFVLGRVENPGPMQFDSPPTLLDVLSSAGGLPLMRKEQVLTRCSIIRGDKIIWIDIKRLLTGETAFNINLQRNDVVYIPDAFDTAVYVLGAVSSPGIYRLTPQMSFLDALGQAGGPTVDANPGAMHLIRPDDKVNLEVDLDQLLEPDPTMNLVMEEGDIIFVPKNDIAKVGYLLEKINPITTMITLLSFMGI